MTFKVIVRNSKGGCQLINCPRALEGPASTNREVGSSLVISSTLLFLSIPPVPVHSSQLISHSQQQKEGRDAPGCWMVHLAKCTPTSRATPHDYFGMFGEWRVCNRGIGRGIRAMYDQLASDAKSTLPAAKQEPSDFDEADAHDFEDQALLLRKALRAL